MQFLSTLIIHPVYILLYIYSYHFGAGDLPKPLLVAIRALRSVVFVGAVAACKVATEDALDWLSKGWFF
jgi:hypothetical protein